MRLAIIPARGGSKRVPRKNIRSFGGKPMISWSIQAAIDCGCFERILVSTDDEEIADIALAYGGEVPFVRPAELADDHSHTVAVVAHAIDWQNQHGTAASEVCCIYATAPFVQADDLRRGLQVLRDSSADYVCSVTNYPFPIQRAIRITQENRIEMFQPQHLNTRSQDLEEAWHDAGQFYWGRAEAWLSGRPLFSHNVAPVVLPRYRVQDIDTIEDWEQAELMFLSMTHERYRNVI